MTKSTLKNKSKVGAIKTFYKATVRKTVRFCTRITNRPMKQIGSLKTDPST